MREGPGPMLDLFGEERSPLAGQFPIDIRHYSGALAFTRPTFNPYIRVRGVVAVPSRSTETCTTRVLDDPPLGAP